MPAQLKDMEDSVLVFLLLTQSLKGDLKGHLAFTPPSVYEETEADRSRNEGGKLAKLSMTSQPYHFFSCGCVVSDTSRFLLRILRQSVA